MESKGIFRLKSLLLVRLHILWAILAHSDAMTANRPCGSDENLGTSQPHRIALYHLCV